MTSTTYHFEGDDLPDDHTLFEFDGVFQVRGSVVPYVAAKINCDPGDGWPAEGGYTEEREARLISPKRIDPDRRRQIELAFVALIESDGKLKDQIDEALAEQWADDRIWCD